MSQNMSLENIAEGALKERFEVELDKVIKNIVDPNTDPKAKREITIKIGFKPNQKRNQVDLQVSVQSALAKYGVIDTSAAVGIEDGKALAIEFRTGQIPGQLSMEDDKTEQVNNKVVDFGFKKA